LSKTGSPVNQIARRAGLSSADDRAYGEPWIDLRQAYALNPVRSSKWRRVFGFVNSRAGAVGHPRE
jgi:hypothetical protein